MKTVSDALWRFAALVSIAALTWHALARSPGGPEGAQAQVIPSDSGGAAHLDSLYGVLLDPSLRRGDCGQCHVMHEEAVPNENNLFVPPNNYLCFSPEGVGGCHATSPTGGSRGYPAQETDRLPQGGEWYGYFEPNVGGAERHGVQEQVSWPGRQVWENPLYSPHAADPDMPVKDDMGQGSCSNCHNVHQGVGPYDLLIDSLGPAARTNTSGAPGALHLCLACHSTEGPPALNPSGRFIEDFYDNVARRSGSNPGHAFVNSYGPIQAGTKLPCYECHNPHGSQGFTGAAPNAYLISDQRPGWYGLTDIRNDADQARRFCSGCHPYADGVGGGPVMGISLPPLPDEDAHRSTSLEHCMECHGRDYSTPFGHNVHHPGGAN